MQQFRKRAAEFPPLSFIAATSWRWAHRTILLMLL